MFLHLSFVHIFDFFDHKIWDNGPSFRIVVVVDIYVVIVDNLNDF
jgi:hypothetical protein